MSEADIAPRSPKRFQLLSTEYVLGLPPPEWAIHNILPRSGVVSIYGKSGTAKSMLVKDLCGKLTASGQWFGHPVTATLRSVLFILEGQSGIGPRVAAWQKFNGIDFPEHNKFIFDSFAINDDADVALFATKLQVAGGADVIVIDTLNRASSGADENRSADMGKIISGAAKLQELTGALVILIHHAGKDEGRGPRGHSSLFAAMDAIIEVKRDDNDKRWWRLEKAKDGEDGIAHSFELEKVDLGVDKFGYPVTSVAIKESDEPVPSRAKAAPLGKNQSAVMTQFEMLMVEQSILAPTTAEPDAPIGISYDDCVLRCKDCIDSSDSRHRTERAKEALNSLIKAGHIHEHDRVLTLPG